MQHMQTIGERLEEARKRKGMSVREAAESTKIRGDYLQKFEANSFDIDLPPLYIRGFVRTYARFLELDQERTVAEVDALLKHDGKPAKRDARDALGRVDFGGEQRPADATEPAAAPARSQRDQAAMVKIGLTIGGAVLVLIVLIMLVNALFSRRPAVSPTPVAPAPATTVQADVAQTLVLTAVEPTRVKIVQDLDGAVLFNGSLARGESRSVKKQGKLAITVESGKNLRMEVNGRSYPIPLDGYGRFFLD